MQYHSIYMFKESIIKSPVTYGTICHNFIFTLVKLLPTLTTVYEVHCHILAAENVWLTFYRILSEIYNAPPYTPPPSVMTAPHINVYRKATARRTLSILNLE